MHLKKNRGGFVEFIFLLMFVWILFMIYAATRTMDMAENEMRRQQGLPEKEMITDKLHNVVETDEQKIKRLEQEIQELKEKK